MGESLVQQGLDMMLFGMGTVFVFLTILVTATYLMSRVVSRFFPEKIALEAAVVRRPSQSAAPVDERVLKVIQTAVDQHRGRK